MRIKIYSEDNPDQHLAETLEDLVVCLRRATQSEVTLEGNPKKDSGSGIWVGRTTASSRFSGRLDELDHDGYLLWGNGSQLIIGGKTSYGTANGVYSFIHRFLGVRWFAPGPLFEFIPNLESFKLPKIVEFIGHPSTEPAIRQLLAQPHPHISLGTVFRDQAPSLRAQGRDEDYPTGLA
jgi:hypothetical protein